MSELTNINTTMRRLSIFSLLLVLAFAFVACKKDKDDDDDDDNNDQIPDTEVNVVTKRGGSTLDQICLLS
ncbi:MAG: hypothetical protein U5L96_13940 [Owenweeksia sp.]|nr:hypothetical protein [Owenweeksia sp.]